MLNKIKTLKGIAIWKGKDSEISSLSWVKRIGEKNSTFPGFQVQSRDKVTIQQLP